MIRLLESDEIGASCRLPARSMIEDAAARIVIASPSCEELPPSRIDVIANVLPDPVTFAAKLSAGLPVNANAREAGN